MAFASEQTARDAKTRAKRTWGASPAGTAAADGAAPGSEEFFTRARDYRNSREQPWLPSVVPFDAMRGKRVVEIGFGVGFDAYTFLRNGSQYTGVDLTPENAERTKKHLAPYGFDPDVREGDAENLPFPDGSFDVAFSNGVLHHVPDIQRAFREIARVLKTGGEFFVLLYHRNSMVYRVNVFLTAFFNRRTIAHQLSLVEMNSAGETPIVNVYSRSELRTLLTDAGFTVKSVKVRKLLAEDLLRIPVLWRLYRFVPQKLMDVVGTAIGWYVIARAERGPARR
jgi:ubiquinone/menaquinone biosynthesis C-methylase UbiE